MGLGLRHFSGGLLAASLLILGVAPARPSSAHPAGGPLTITVWDWHYADTSIGGLGAAMKLLDADYMKTHPGIVIKHVGQPFSSYFTLERTAVASKRGPDVLMNYPSPALFDFYRGLLPLNQYITPDMRKNLTGWALASTGLSDKGQVYGVPWSSQGILFYYNKALFRKAGLNPEVPPTTWAELLKDCAALKKAGVVPISAGFKDGYYAEWFMATMSTQFMSPSELAGSYANPAWNGAANLKGLQYMLELKKMGYMTPNAEGIPLFSQTVNSFSSGKAAIFLGLAANGLNWAQFRPSLKEDLGAMLPPVLPGSLYPKPRFDVSPGEAWSITRWSSHPKETFDYIAFLTNPANQEKKYTLAGALPNNLLARPSASYGPAVQILKWSRDTSLTFVSPADEIRTNPEATFDKLITSVVAGQLSLADAMQQVQTTQSQTPPLPGI